MRLSRRSIALLFLPLALLAAPEQVVLANLTYQEPGAGPKPNFSPKGTQVALSQFSSADPLPEGAAQPAKVGVVQIGPDQNSWVRILVTADAAHPHDFCRLYLYSKRNGEFTHLDQTLTATPSQNEKTKAWWSNFSGAKLSIHYRENNSQPYLVNFWVVRDGEALPDVIRYSVASWRAGRVSINGVEALVAVMDSDNNAVFDVNDRWSVIGAAEPDAAKRVLSIQEARTPDRLMFVPTPGGKELVLEFRGITPDGAALSLAVVDRPITKAADRAPDDSLATERSRPRAAQPFPFIDRDFEHAAAQAKAAHKKLLVDFWASWCGPCHTLDEWIWTDAEVAALLSRDYIAVKLDGDLDKELVKRFQVEGYPTVIVLDPAGKELGRTNYLGSKPMLEFLTR